MIDFSKTIQILCGGRPILFFFSMEDKYYNTLVCLVFNGRKEEEVNTVTELPGSPGLVEQHFKLLENV